MATINRRELLKTSALTGAGLLLAEPTWARKSRSSNERVRFGCIGVGGKGDSDTADAARLGDIVAICDVDEGTLDRAGSKYPSAKKYRDYRKMLEEMGDSIDAVTVSTPDHHHAVAASMAIRMGKHCFVQKPLTHSIWEARRIAELARKHKVATQMGNQGTASSVLRESAALIRAGVVGQVSEVHVWTDRPIWPQGIARPTDMPPVPPTLDWDIWLGPAPVRAYSPAYHPFKWRGWWDFGTGALGDMACHLFNMPFMALDLRDPISVTAETSGHNRDSYPSWSIIRYKFRETDRHPALTMTWYDGGKFPPADLLDGKKMDSNGCIVVGDKGRLYAPGGNGTERQLLGGAVAKEVTFPTSPGHFDEFVRAIQTGEPAMSNFPDYAGPLTETVLLGNLAVWAQGETVEWDAKRMKAHGGGDFKSVIRPDHRKGWDV